MIRSVRAYEAHSEVDPGVVGVSAPIFNADGKIFASLSLAMPEARSKAGDLEVPTALVIQGAERLTREISALADQASGAAAAWGEVIPARQGES